MNTLSHIILIQFFNILNPFLPGVSFLYPLKTSETRRFSYVFKGYKKRTLGGNGLAEYGTTPWKAPTTLTEFLASIYLLKVSNRNTRTRHRIYSKLTIKIPERRHYRRPGVFIVNFEHISHLALMFLLLTLNM